MGRTGSAEPQFTFLVTFVLRWRQIDFPSQRVLVSDTGRWPNSSDLEILRSINKYYILFTHFIIQTTGNVKPADNT
jgi:hypothetical protein